MKQALIFLAEGFEEVEAVTPLDFLRRAGVDAKFVSVCGTLAVTGAHGVVYQADMLFDQHVAAQADMLILPGGMPGAQHLQDHAALGKLLKAFHQEGKFVCAICAAKDSSRTPLVVTVTWPVLGSAFNSFKKSMMPRRIRGSPPVILNFRIPS